MSWLSLLFEAYLVLSITLSNYMLQTLWWCGSWCWPSFKVKWWSSFLKVPLSRLLSLEVWFVLSTYWKQYPTLTCRSFGGVIFSPLKVRRWHLAHSFEGGYKNSPRPSVIPSVHLSVQSSHSRNFLPIITKFLQHVYITEKLYKMQFHKKVAKFFNFNAYLPMFLPHMKAWRYLLIKLLQYLYKGPT